MRSMSRDMFQSGRVQMKLIPAATSASATRSPPVFMCVNAPLTLRQTASGGGLLKPHIIALEQRRGQDAQSSVSDEAHQPQGDDADEDPFREQEQPRVENEK